MLLVQNGVPVLPALLPPPRFAQVNDIIFRSGYPTLRHFRFLLRLRLNMIVSLVPEFPTKDLVEFCSHQNIELLHFECAKRALLSKETVVKVLSLLSTYSQGSMPGTARRVLVHCLDGGNVVGYVCMALRRFVFRWSLQACIDEFCLFAPEFEIEHEEEDWIAELAPKDFESVLRQPSLQTKKQRERDVFRALQPLALEGLTPASAAAATANNFTFSSSSSVSSSSSISSSNSATSSALSGSSNVTSGSSTASSVSSSSSASASAAAAAESLPSLTPSSAPSDLQSGSSTSNKLKGVSSLVNALLDA
jgi:hypothetical protein